MAPMQKDKAVQSKTASTPVCFNVPLVRMEKSARGLLKKAAAKMARNGDKTVKPGVKEAHAGNGENTDDGVDTEKLGGVEFVALVLGGKHHDGNGRRGCCPRLAP